MRFVRTSGFFGPFLLAVLIGLLFSGVVSCGDDDDDPSTSSGQADDDTGDDDTATDDDTGDDDTATDDDTGDDDTATDDDTTDDDTAADDDADDDTGDDDTVNDYWPAQTMFDAILEKLVTEFWDPSGNWQGDLTHDATSFAPEVLFGYGLEMGFPELVAMAEKTCEWELYVIGQTILTLDPDGIDLIVGGVLALWWGYQYDVDPLFEPICFALLPVGDFAAQYFMQFLVGFAFTQSAAIGYLAHLHHLIARHFGDGPIHDWSILKARILIDQAYRDYYDTGLQLFEDGDLMSNGGMLMAVAENAYLAHDVDMLNRAFDLYDTMEDELWDPVRGGYWDGISVPTKNFSNNVLTLRGIVNLYEATGDSSFRLQAEDHLAWMENDLFYDDLCYHHWTEGAGRATYFCTGRNFLLLDAIYHLHSVGMIDL